MAQTKRCQRVLWLLALLPAVLLGAPSDRELLFQAVDAGDAAEVGRALDRGASPDQRDDRGNTPLIIASLKGHVRLVELLLQRGADVNLVDDDGGSALLRGAHHPRILALLLHARADPHQTDHYGHTPLMLAAAAGELAAVRQLLDAKVELNARDRRGLTALDRARMAGREELVDWLLERGALEGSGIGNKVESARTSARLPPAGDPDWRGQLTISDLQPPRVSAAMRFSMQGALLLICFAALALAQRRLPGAWRPYSASVLPQLLLLLLTVWLTNWLLVAKPTYLGSLAYNLLPASLLLLYPLKKLQGMRSLRRPGTAGRRLSWILLLVAGSWLAGYYWYRIDTHRWGMEGIPLMFLFAITPWSVSLLLGQVLWMTTAFMRGIGARMVVTRLGQLVPAALVAGWVGALLSGTPLYAGFERQYDAHFDRLSFTEEAVQRIGGTLNRSTLFTYCQQRLAIPPDVDEYMAVGLERDGPTVRVLVQIPFCKREQLARAPTLTARLLEEAGKLAARHDVDRVELEWLLADSHHDQVVAP